MALLNRANPTYAKLTAMLDLTLLIAYNLM